MAKNRGGRIYAGYSWKIPDVQGLERAYTLK